MDAGKSFLGIGGSNKYTAAKGFLGESTSEIPKLGQAIAKSLGNVKTTVVSAAQEIFSGSGGLASVFQEGFGGVTSIAQKAIGGLGSIFGNISTTLGGTKLFSGIAGIFKGIGRTVTAAVGTAGGTGVAGTIAAAVSHIPVIGTILLGGTLAVGAIGGGSFTNGTVYSSIDENRNITVNSAQVDVTQENNGQIVPFEMPRFYDGIDLMGMTIQIHYMNANNEENYAAPICGPATWGSF